MQIEPHAGLKSDLKKILKSVFLNSRLREERVCCVFACDKEVEVGKVI